MDQKDGEEWPRLLGKQLEHMVAFADANEDFVLAAWLSQAQDRLKLYYLES